MTNVKLIFNIWLVSGLILMMFSSCTPNTSKNNTTIKVEKKEHLTSEIDYKYFYYQFVNDSILQKVKIEYKRSCINFVYQVKNTLTGQEDVVSGKACTLVDKNNEMELGEDENGNAYTVNVYEFKDKKYWLRINIDDEKEKVTIDDYSENSRLSSVNIMKKKAEW